MKYLTLILLTLISINVYSQIGIGTDSPKATLDISALESNDKNITTPDGILIPRVSKIRAQNMKNVYTSTLIYIDDITEGNNSGTTEFVDSTGFYYFENNKWVKLNKDIVIEPDKRIYAILNFSDDQVLSSKNIEQNIKINGELNGINTESNIEFINDKTIKFPANKTFKITGSIGIRGSRADSGNNNPLYLFTEFLTDNESKKIITTQGYTESSTEKFDDGGQSNPMIIFKTGLNGGTLSMKAKYGGTNSLATNGAYIAGKPTTQSIGSYLIVEEIF